MNYSEILSRTLDVVTPFYDASELAQVNAEKEKIESVIANAPTVKVPVMGVFTAGKTTLFNTLLGAENGKLPVDLTPTTSIPCEIYPTDGETYACIVRDGQEIFRGSVEDYGKVETHPGDVGALYVDHPDIRRWYDNGITLVDMPGSDSGMREHNEAILRYVTKGNQFVFFVSATAGALGTTDIALLREIKQYGLKEVIITKADLVSAESLESVRAYIGYQLKDVFGVEPTTIATVCSATGDIEAFKQCIDSINAREVMAERILPLVKGFVDSQRFALEARLELIANAGSIEEIDAKIKEIKENIANLEKAIHDSVNRVDSPEKSTNDVLLAIQQAIADNADLVTDAIVNSNKGETTKDVADQLISIVRPAIVNAMRIEQDEYIAALNAEISKITEKILESITIDDDVISGIINENETIIIGSIRMLADRLLNSQNLYMKIMGHALNFIADYVPDLLRGIFGNDEKAKQKLTDQVRGPIAKNIAEGLRGSVLSVVKKRQRQILESALKQYESRIEQMREAIKSLERQKQAGIGELTAKGVKIQAALDEVNEIYKAI